MTGVLHVKNMFVHFLPNERWNSSILSATWMLMEFEATGSTARGCFTLWQQRQEHAVTDGAVARTAFFSWNSMLFRPSEKSDNQCTQVGLPCPVKSMSEVRMFDEKSVNDPLMSSFTVTVVGKILKWSLLLYCLLLVSAFHSCCQCEAMTFYKRVE